MLRAVPLRLVAISASAVLLACATYEPAPLHDHEEETKAGAPAAAGSAGRGGNTPSSNAFGGSGGHAGVAPAAGAAQGGSGTVVAAGSAGVETGGTDGDAAGGTAGAAQGQTQSWTFDVGDEGWALREQSPELTATLSAATGALQLADVPFSAAKQYVDVAYEFATPADVRGRTLGATVQRTSGGFVGAQLYVYGGAWVSPGFESLSSGDVTLLSLAIDGVTNAGFTPQAVSRIGIKFATGSNATNSFGATTIELSEVVLE